MPDLDAEIDPTGKAVLDWLEANLPPLISLLDHTVENQGGIEAHRFSIPPEAEQDVVEIVAVGAMARRLMQRPSAFAAWHSALTTKEPLAASEGVVRRFVGSALGDPTNPRSSSHLFGFVAEHTIAELLRAVDHGLGLPIHLEQHDWSVTDPGGDCVAIYRMGEEFHFRLWESKAVTGATVLPATSVGEAIDQLDLRAWEYLARWAPVAQRLEDDTLADFFVRMPDLWSDGDLSAGAGIAVSTHSSKPIGTCFSGLVGRFNLPDANKQGSLVLATDFAKFAQSVRTSIWKGAAWSEP